MDHCDRHDGGKILPGGWLQEREFAGLGTGGPFAKRLVHLNFPGWHGLCKEAREPPLGRARGCYDGRFAWEGQPPPTEGS
jgi:hypothetical protein